MDNNTGLQNVTKMYEKLNYFDQYGGSLILFIIITIILILIISYCLIMVYAQPIIDDWPNQRCKPNIIPFAGLITHPDGMSASDYTSQNFTYCTQNILSSITGIAVEPLTFVTNTLNKMADMIKNDIQSVRSMFDKVRTMFQAVSQEIMGRILNFTIPLQQIVISFKDLLSKIQGTLTAGLFTLLGSYYTLKSLMGAIAQFIITILITLSILIAVFWIIPFTWGVAATNTVIFIAFAIPMTIILAFMIDVLHVKTGLSIPKVKCFDKDTEIIMEDGSLKKISEIKVGDILMENNEVTACIKVETKGSYVYNLDNIIVSNSHIMYYHSKWIHVSEHPNAIKYLSYKEPYLYCLNTTKKIIKINGRTFTDWDEIYDNDINKIMRNKFYPISKVEEIHCKLDSGFSGQTLIKLKNGIYRQIKNIIVGDILENGEKVYGIVEINGKNIPDQFEYNLGKKLVVEGTANLLICDNKINGIHNNLFDYVTLIFDKKNKIKLNVNHDKLYHLLTDKDSFYIGNIRFYDYNAAIDIFLEKNNGKIFSMKYV
jgi:hypothetical protein